MRGKQSDEDGTDPETQINGCDSVINHNLIQNFAVDRTPTIDNQRAQTPDLSRSQTPDISRNQTLDVSRSHTPDVPRSHTPDVPRSHTPDVPRSYTPDVLRSYTPDVPRSYTPDVPRSYTPDVPRFQTAYDLRRQTPNVSRSHTPDVPRFQTPYVLRRQSPDVPRFQTPYDLRRQTPDVSRSQTPRRQAPDVEIVFKNLDCARKYQTRLDFFLRNLLSYGETFVINTEVGSADGIQIHSEPMDTDSVFQTPIRRTPSNQDNIAYTSPFTSLLDESNETEEKKETRKRPRFTCFNCLGDHHIKSCPEAYDGYRVSNNRKDFLEIYSPSRYHADESLPCDTGNLRPGGTISEDLRIALNFRENQLPPYIYTMRLLGYPPGWLEESQVEDSGLSLFDSEKKVNDGGTSGEINEKYDGTKFIKYPGFNCHAPKGTIEEGRQFGTPPIQRHQLLTEALNHSLVTTTASDAYKKRRHDGPTSSSKKSKSNNDSSNHSASETCESPSVIQKNLDESVNSPASSSDPELRSIPIPDTPNLVRELPGSNKFSSGITEHLNFENLPDAVGKFDIVRNALGQARRRLTKDN